MNHPSKNRWLLFVLLGLVFGILDWYFLDLLASIGRNESLNNQMQQASEPIRSLGVIILLALNFGIWLVPVIPAAVVQYQQTRVLWKAALSAVVVWSAAMVSYYAYYTFLLMFVSLPGMEFMLYARRELPTYWSDWWVSFQQVILGQFLEWIWVAIVGGAIVGAISAAATRWFLQRRKN